MGYSSVDGSKPPRSTGKIAHRRIPNGWDGDRDFKILSLDGGGMRGIFQAAFLGELEKRFLGGDSIGRYFDLITGASTGGIIALGLGKGLSAQELTEFYREEGRKIFPPRTFLLRKLRSYSRIFKYVYKPEKLRVSLVDLLGDTKLGESDIMLCIPSSEGEHRDVVVFKTAHHSDFKMDWRESMYHIGMATSAAPTYFKVLEDDGYKLLDGGLWANNTILIGTIEVLTSFDVPRSCVKVLSVGNSIGDKTMSKWQKWTGGILAYRKIVETMMEFQSEGAIGQAGLLIGAESISRITPESYSGGIKPIELDDWNRSTEELPKIAISAAEDKGEEIASIFLNSAPKPYIRFYPSENHNINGQYFAERSNHET